METFLLNFHWQGNVRELRNLIERGVLVGEGPALALAHLGISTNGRMVSPRVSQAEALSPYAPLPPEGIDLSAVETHYIRAAYQRAGGNDRTAASLLKMSYYAFRYKKKKIKDLH
ncbi:MAG: hypothetical protein V2B19_08890 [Pseudomonadota bacterium]